MAAASLGTQKLLHRMKDEGHLPELSDAARLPVPHQLRVDPRRDRPHVGPDRLHLRRRDHLVASTPTRDTHIEPVRYGKGFNTMAMLQTVLTDGDGDGPRWQAWLQGDVDPARQRPRPLRLQALVRAHRDRAGHAEPRQLDHDLRQAKRLARPLAHDLAGRATAPRTRPGSRSPTRPYAGWPRTVGGTAGGNIGEPFGMPLTAHFIGGCAIGDSPETGVIDPYQRVFGYPGLHVADGSAISANLGVNPSLTITAQAERAMAFWPNKGEADPRPALGEQYERVQPGRPALPGRPGSAPGALRLPIVGRELSRSLDECRCRSDTGTGIGGPDRAISAQDSGFYRRNPPAKGSLSRAEPVVMLPPFDRSPLSRRCPTDAWTIRARPPSLPGRALVHLLGCLPTAFPWLLLRSGPAGRPARADRRRRVAGGCSQRGCVGLARATPRF